MKKWQASSLYWVRYISRSYFDKFITFITFDKFITCDWINNEENKDFQF